MRVIKDNVLYYYLVSSQLAEICVRELLGIII